MWTKIIQDLIASGLSESAIAKAVGVEQPTINRLKSGAQKTTAYETGEKIKALHAGLANQRKGHKKAS